MALTTNYSRERTRKRKTPTNPTDSLETSLSLPIKRKHKNWFHPHIWPAIDMAGRHTNYSSREVVKHLQSRYRDTNLYDSLAPSTVNGWIDLECPKRGWNERIKKLVEGGTCWTPGQTYKSILDGQVELIGHIKEMLLGIRAVRLLLMQILRELLFLALSKQNHLRC